MKAELVLSLVTVYLCFAATANGEEISKPANTLAARLEGMLAEMKDTHYQAKTEINEKTGSLKCDCSGLLCYVLRHEFPEAYVSLNGVESPWRTRPYSVTFYETFLAATEHGQDPGGWQRVRRMMDMRPGDILAWRKDSIERGVSTGHTCMIAGLPKLDKDSRVRVRVIDSTRKPHANDTRSPGATGVGAGEMWFLVDDQGEPTGFFVDGSGVQAQSTKVAVGRLMDSSPKLAKGRPGSQDIDFLDLTKDEAIALAKKQKIPWRIITEDGEVRPVKMKLRDDRVNFVVEKGIVVRVRRG